ncbi:MAG: UDP-N-acetylmuramoyl-tripeptide--D-alanyl-D-alanine ligase [Candidatus Fermentibacteraceae bacterium]
MRLDSLAACLGVTGNTGYTFDRAFIDSRNAGPQSLFFALPGSRTHGHDFVQDALSLGAAAVVSRKGFPGPVLVVPDTTEALFHAGVWARSQFSCPVAAITGSSGKTTTRELLMLALGSVMSVDGTRGNLNNRLGLPLSLLNASKDASALVLELGMNHAGELLSLGAAAAPDISVVTNVGTAHMEFFGSRDGIAHAKAELLRTTRTGGTAVIPVGEPILRDAAKERNLRVVTTGPGGDAWVEDGVLMPWRIMPGLSVPGGHNLENALSATLAAELLGVDPETAVKAMEGYLGMPGRGRVLQRCGFTVYDESYNANPDSTMACLDLLAGSREKGIAVLGDMLELGGLSAEAHRLVLERALEMGLRLVVLVGSAFEEVWRGDKGVSWVPDAGSALELLKASVREGDRVLVKGSHSLGLDSVVRGITGEGC